MEFVDCICLCPVADCGVPRLAIAAERAGGIGVVDLEFTHDEDAAAQSIDALLRVSSDRVGVRLLPAQIPLYARLLGRLSQRGHWLILGADKGACASDIIATLPHCPERRLLIEVCDGDSATELQDCAVHGFIAKGNESGGWIGEDSTFVLLQKLLDACTRPVYVRGGIGPNTAAACRMAGAAGVVLDDQLLLLSETFIPRRLLRHVGRLTGQETITMAEHPRGAFRGMLLPGFSTPTRPERNADIGGTLEPRDVGWHAQAKMWPAGQAVGLAPYFRDLYGTLGKLIRAIQSAAMLSPQLASAQRAFAPGAPLAQAHMTEFPVVQGPMTRVSDTPQFAQAVARAGGLPFLALAMMREKQVLDLLTQTQSLLQGRPWGVGLLGFVPQALRDEQIAAIRKAKPPFALIAGGRPDQSMALEAEGIATYLHVPSPRLLQLFLEQGGRRFVFEGRESGGHIGPFSSFVLWEHMIHTLLDHTGAHGCKDMDVLFAGGIHDARTSAMLSVMVAPIVARGVRVGILMGTAYVFCEEAVSCGAIVKGFQEEALRCTNTACLETGNGHLTRCAVTPFVQEFMNTRSDLLRGGKTADDVRDSLERLNLGRLRIASKGLARDDRGTIIALDEPHQHANGMYMIGQAATLCDTVRTIQSLHETVTCGASEILQRAVGHAPEPDASEARPSDIAIIGIGTLLPGADTPERYWQNILAQRNAISEIPRERWDWQLYFDPDRRARDRIYAKWGGFIDEVPFDPTRFGIPPNSMRSIDPLQLLTLEVVRRALGDAGYPDGGPDRERAAVILGAGGGLGDVGLQYGVRAELPRINESNSRQVWDRLPEWTEESFPGCLLNVAAGRVANRFNFHGSNFTVDAACASSLAAIDIAVRELESGRSDFAVAGGIDTLQSPFAYFCFSKTQALSPRGVAQTFDRNADGIVISEGLAVVVLKRLADAQRDGDRIYSVIKAIGSSSDGKALGLTAPLPEGQKRALKRAAEKSGVRPSSLGLFEAHGTGTVVGDGAEAETIISVLKADGAAPHSCAIGSVKTLIGHTKATAGAAGLIKAALALHHRALPPHAGVEQPIDSLADPKCPALLMKQPRPWLNRATHPRRAGVNAFGFGGTNFHAVLEEAPQDMTRHGAPGGALWPCELIVLRAATRDSLVEQIRRLHRLVESGNSPRLRDIAWSCALRSGRPSQRPFALAAAVKDFDALREALTAALAVNERRSGAVLPRSVRMTEPERVPASVPGDIAFLFPGQGSQQPDMFREAAMYLADFRDALEYSDGQLASSFDRPLSEYIFPPAAFTPEVENAIRKEITDTRVAQPAIGAVELGCIALAARLGIEPRMVAGHSYGELTALHAAGVLTKEDFLSLSALRGRALGVACDSANAGSMAAVTLEPSALQRHLEDHGGIIVANHNAPKQTVVSGPLKEVENLVQRLSAKGITAQLLPVAGAFHSPLMNAAHAPFAATLAGVAMGKPRLPVFSNASANPYPQEADEIRRLLADQLLQPVEFVRQIENMYGQGARAFVELGPRGVLTGLVKQILAGREFTAVSFGASGGSMEDVLTALAVLAVENVEFRLDSLFDGRDVVEIDLDGLSAPTRAAATPGWFVSGGWTRAAGEPKGRTGRLPFLDAAFRAAQPAGLAEPVTAPPPASQRAAENLPASAPPPAPAARIAAGNAGDAKIAALHDYQNVMREFLTVQERVMAQFLGGSSASAPPAVSANDAMQAHAAAQSAAPSNRVPDTAEKRPNSKQTTPVEPGSAPQTPIAQATETLDKKVLMDRLLALASERTGYPQEMLGGHQDVEADLGIDSIKRVEILGALLRHLPSSVRPAIQSDMGVLTRVKTFDGMIERILSAADTKAPPSGQAVAPKPELMVSVPPTPAAVPGKNAPRNDQSALPQRSNDTGLVPRFRVEGRIQPLDDRRKTISQGLWLVTADELSVAPKVAALLAAAGAQVCLLDDAAMANSQLLEHELRGRVARQGTVRGIVHLAGLTRPHEITDLAGWRDCSRRHVKNLFRLLKFCSRDLTSSQAGACVLAASALGGAGARAVPGRMGAVTAGGIVGLLKTVAREFEGVRVKAIDFDPAESSGRIAEAIMDELSSADPRIEVGYGRNGRTVFDTVRAPLAAASAAELEMGSDWVVLVTGGARGITAEAAYELSRRGARLILAGRSPRPADHEPALTADAADAAALRSVFLKHARHNAPPASAAAIEKKVREVLKEREIRENLARLKTFAASVEYVSLDVCDEPAVAALLERIYRDYGRLDGVIHGAGIIEDRLIEDKDESSFDRVFDTKVDSSFILARHVKPDTLRFLVFYASVSGRIGNRGQADYAAANEVLNRLAWQLDRQWPNTRVVAINWGPWDSNGMASAQVLRELRSRGIVPVQAQSGRSFLMEELKKGRKGDVEIIAGDGPWPSFENSQVPVQSPPASNFRAQLPFVRNAPAIASGGAVAMEHTFSVAADPYLEDHLLDSAPVLPLAAVLEWVAEFVQSAWPEWTVVSVRDLRVLKGIVVGDREQIKAEFRAKSSTHSNGDSLNVGIEVVDVERKVVCYRATAVLQTCEIRDAGGRVTPLPPARRLDAGTAYRDYLFHGDRFRLLTAITSITDAGIDAAAIPSDAAAWLNPGAKRSNVEGPIGHWLFDPGIVDVAPQLAIVWSRMKYGMTAIPNRFGTATRFGKGPMTGPMNVALRVRPSSDPCNLIYDATFFAADGSVRLFLEECNSACSERLNKIAIPAQ